jgi:general secretion pathway protein M
MRLLDTLVYTWRNLERRDRLWCGYALICLLAVVTGWLALAAKTTELERKRTARESVLKELLPLKVTYRSAKLTADQLAGRMATLRSDDTPAKVIEEIGIRGKGVKITPLKGEVRGGAIEDAADVRIEGLTANEMVNLIYRLEKGSRPMTVKKVNLRVRFDDPARFDCAMTIVLLKPVPGPAK